MSIPKDVIYIDMTIPENLSYCINCITNKPYRVGISNETIIIDFGLDNWFGVNVDEINFSNTALVYTLKTRFMRWCPGIIE